MKPIKPKKEYEKQVANIIRQWQYNLIYKPALKILQDNVVLNDSQILPHAIQSGTIYYQNGAFYSNTGRFSNNIALELEKIGAKYSKYGRCYRLSKDKLPTSLLWYIDEIKAKTAEKVILLNQFLKGVEDTVAKELDKITMEQTVESIFFDLQERLNKSYKQYKIQTIAPRLSDNIAKQISDNYINNLKFWIKEWEPEQIAKMRDQISQMAINGKSQTTIANYIQKEFNVIDRHKAEFLARNETAIAVTSYLKEKYHEDGYTHFVWHTNLDGRERPLHKKLNGLVFAYDDPPIIYENEKKGIQQRGFPGETYNCRCGFTPLTKEIYANIKQQNKFGLKF